MAKSCQIKIAAEKRGLSIFFSKHPPRCHWRSPDSLGAVAARGESKDALQRAPSGGLLPDLLLQNLVLKRWQKKKVECPLFL